MAADHTGGVLLLDHVSGVSNAMVGFMRRLVGGLVGVLWVFDIDVERERRLLKAGRLGGLPVRMPLTPAVRLRRLWRARTEASELAPIEPKTERHLLRAARGRPGWILRCAELASHARYWQHDKLALVNVLCMDTEIVLREGNAEALPFDDLHGQRR